MRLRQYHIFISLKLNFNISQVHGILQKILRHPGELYSKQVRELCRCSICSDFTYNFPCSQVPNLIHLQSCLLKVAHISPSPPPPVAITDYLGTGLFSSLFSPPLLFPDPFSTPAAYVAFLKSKSHHVISCLKHLNIALFVHEINIRLLNLIRTTHGALPLLTYVPQLSQLSPLLTAPHSPASPFKSHGPIFPLYLRHHSLPSLPPKRLPDRWS